MLKFKKAFAVPIALLLMVVLVVSCAAGTTPAATQAPSGAATAPNKAPVAPTQASAAPTQAAVAPAQPTAAAAAIKPVLKIGAVWATSGSLAAYGNRYAIATKIATDEINAGAKYPFSIQLITADVGSDPATAVNAGTKLIVQDNVNALFLPTGSGQVIAMQAMHNQYDIAGVTPSAGDRRTATESKGHIFQMIPNTLDVDKAFFKLLFDKIKPKAFYGVYVNSEPGYSEMQQQKDILTAAGINIVGAIQVNQENPDFAPVVTRIKSSGADMVGITVIGAQQAQLAWALREAGVKVQLADPSYYDPGTWNNGKEAVDGMIVGAWFQPETAKAQPFVNKYKELAKGEVPDAHAANAYDIIYLLADAAARAGSMDRVAIKNAIGTTNFEGVSSPVSFNPDGTRKTFNFTMLRYNFTKGQLEEFK